MQLKPVGTHPLFDAASEPKRLHFAISSGVTHLYALQDDDTLATWSLSQTLIPARGTRLKLPLPLHAPAHQFTGDDLLLWEGDDLVRVNCATPAQPKVVGSFTLPGLQSCVVLGALLHVERAVDGEADIGLCPLPTTLGERPKVQALLRARDDFGRYAVALGDRVLWAGHRGLELMRGATVEARLAHESGCAVPLVAGPEQLVVLETEDMTRTAVTFVDVEGKKLKKVASFHPKKTVSAWCVSGERLTVVLRGAKRVGGKGQFSHALVVFDLHRAVELASIPLSFVEVAGDAQTRVLWLGVRDDTCAVLLGSGVLHRFTAR